MILSGGSEKFESSTAAWVISHTRVMTLGSLYSNFMCRAILILALAVTSGLAIDIPRKAPEFVINTGPNQQLLVSQYRGKVLCLVFILTT